MTYKEMLIGLVDEYLSSQRTDIDMDLLEARIHLGREPGDFSEDEEVAGINEVIDYYYNLHGLDEGRNIERIINYAFTGDWSIPPTR
jgi:hypothetical protein